jgi:hypothetical protein
MNHEARTETVEVLFNPAELTGLTNLCKALGVAKSTFLRSLSNTQVRTHGMPASSQKESRRCPGAGRVACRAGARAGMRRHL